MTKPAEVTLVEKQQRPRILSVDFLGLLLLRMPVSTIGDDLDVIS